MGQIINSPASVWLYVFHLSYGRNFQSILMKLCTIDWNPKIKIEFVGDQSLTIPYPIFLNRDYLRSGGRVLNIWKMPLNWQTHHTTILAQISVAQLNSPTPITLTMSRNGGRISQTSEVIANFLLKFSNFRCHGNRGWSGTNFHSTVKFADPDYPLLGPEMVVVYPIQAELLPIFC